MPPVSEAQRRAMYAAASGHSTLGIPKKVGEEFVGKDGAPIAAGICFVAPDGEVLLLRRSSTEENYAGHWALPGGKANDGETAEDAATRESIEELGLDPDDGALKLLHKTSTPNGMVYHTFARPTETKFVPKLNGEHSGYAWASLDMLPEPMHPSVKGVLTDGLRHGAADMSPEDWTSLRTNFAKWTREEERESEHAQDALLAMDRSLYDTKTGKRVLTSDRFALDRAASVRSYDADGHLKIARTPISKANICEYFGHEIPGAEELGLDPRKRYKLLRDPKELAKGAASSNGKQLLIQHIPVNADDPQKDKTVGAVGTDAEFEHPYLYNSLSVWDREGIDGIEDESRKELSCAYRYKADMTPGTYEGEPYDGVMRDIDFNHVALVPAGRAGADVVVGDEQPKGTLVMSKIVLSRKATFLAGAAAALLMPRLAKDEKLDILPLFAGITGANFKTKKADIYAKFKGAKLAQDASVSDVVQLLDELENHEVAEGADMEPNSAVPMTKEQMDKKAKDAAEEESKKKEAEDKAARDKKAADRKSARDSKIENFKKARGLDAETCKALDELMGEVDGEDAEEGRASENTEGKEGGGGEDKKGMDKKAMDAAIAAAKTETLQLANKIAGAREFVFPWAGKLAMDATCEADVYRAAIEQVGHADDIVGVPADANTYKAILKLIPQPGAASRMAHDSVSERSADSQKRTSVLDRIGVA
jgi:8-oxo-dGTP pyrophosphatase MutT (NUDIX family)